MWLLYVFAGWIVVVGIVCLDELSRIGREADET